MGDRDGSSLEAPAATTWKTGVLSSSVTLEYEAAKLLASSGFQVSADFGYHRADAGIDKQFTVDVRGVRPLRADSGHRASSSTLDILIECKYRHPGVSWVFLPHPNEGKSSLCPPLQGVEHFSPWFIRDYSWDDSDKLTVCYKGFEIGFGGGKEKVLDAQIRHGLAQLQFSLPSLVALRVRAHAFRPIENNKPFFFIPILVTTAPLIVADRAFDTAAVKNATTVGDLGREVPALTVSIELGPDFERHCQAQLRDLGLLVKTRVFQTVEQVRKDAGFSEIDLPSWLATRIEQDGANAAELADFKNILVCNITALQQELALINEAFSAQASSLGTEPLVKL